MDSWHNLVMGLGVSDFVFVGHIYAFLSSHQTFPSRSRILKCQSRLGFYHSPPLTRMGGRGRGEGGRGVGCGDRGIIRSQGNRSFLGQPKGGNGQKLQNLKMAPGRCCVSACVFLVFVLVVQSADGKLCLVVSFHCKYFYI